MTCVLILVQHLRQFACACLAAASLAAVAPGAVFAQDAAQAALPPAVIVTGKMRLADAGKGIALTPAFLEKLPQHSFTTSAPWTKRTHTYTGVLLRDLLAHLGASATTIEATALNDYAISIPVEDTRQFNVIVAYKVDGQPVPVRDRGPLLVMYPFDGNPQLQHRNYYERSIWQLKALNLQ